MSDKKFFEEIFKYLESTARFKVWRSSEWVTKSNYTGQISLPKPWKYYYREEDGTDYEVTNQL